SAQSLPPPSPYGCLIREQPVRLSRQRVQFRANRNATSNEPSARDTNRACCGDSQRSRPIAAHSSTHPSRYISGQDSAAENLRRRQSANTHSSLSASAVHRHFLAYAAASL